MRGLPLEARMLDVRPQGASKRTERGRLYAFVFRSLTSAARRAKRCASTGHVSFYRLLPPPRSSPPEGRAYERP